MEIGVIADNADTVARSIYTWRMASPAPHHAFTISGRFSREDYLHTIYDLKRHIARGDCYEINFCQEFYAIDAHIDPCHIFTSLSKESPNPFACFYKLDNRYLLCASPERFLKKSGNKLLSQPIKGTISRNIADEKADSLNRQLLFNNPKERAENIMIVDLVRNDLAKICGEGTVQVDELMGVYGFPQVYQMISTVSGIVADDVAPAEIFKATFPMGSMTGAPKKSVMELIEKYERTKRGLFSGSVGYISPERDMDFNVVIRSILYNADSQYLSFQAGSAITYKSDPESEYKECLLKAAAIKKVLKV
jgi:para-aminobenzoate synthetase component 1